MTTCLPTETGEGYAPQSLAQLAADHVADYRGRSVPHLASLAECGCPPRGSDGARFLSHVADETADALAEILDDLGPDAFAGSIVAAVHKFRSGEDDDDLAREIADAAGDPVTVTRWAEFVDLAAWQEDLDLVDCNGLTLTEVAGVALREIARTLVDALAGEVAEIARQYAEDNVSAPSVRDVADEFVDHADVAQIDYPADEPETVVLTLAGGAEITLCDERAGEGAADPDTVVGYTFAVNGPAAPGDDAHHIEWLETGGDGYDGDPGLYSLYPELARLVDDWCHAPEDAETAQ